MTALRSWSNSSLSAPEHAGYLFGSCCDGGHRAHPFSSATLEDHQDDQVLVGAQTDAPPRRGRTPRALRTTRRVRLRSPVLRSLRVRRTPRRPRVAAGGQARARRARTSPPRSGGCVNDLVAS